MAKIPAKGRGNATCGQVGYTYTDCRNEPKCVNCSGAHSASSKECPKWALEKKVQAVKAERGVSFIEARKIVISENKVQPSRTQPMATVVRSSGGPQRTTTRSMTTQTNLTWPENKKEPSFIPSPACTSSLTQTSERASPQATTSSGAEGRSPSKPSRPPRKNQRPSPSISTQSCKWFPSFHDRPPGAGLKSNVHSELPLPLFYWEILTPTELAGAVLIMIASVRLSRISYSSTTYLL